MDRHSDPPRRMEESPDYGEIFIGWRIVMLLTVRGCFDPPRRTQHDGLVRIGMTVFIVGLNFTAEVAEFYAAFRREKRADICDSL